MSIPKRGRVCRFDLGALDVRCVGTGRGRYRLQGLVSHVMRFHRSAERRELGHDRHRVDRVGAGCRRRPSRR